MVQPPPRLRRLSSQVQQLKNDFIGRKETEAFAGSVIDEVKNGRELQVGDIGEVRAPGEEKAKQAIDIFVASALPGSVGIR